MNITLEKLNLASNLRAGDKVKLINGEVATFVRMKQKNFVGSMNGKNYNIPVMMLSELVEKAPEKSTNEEWKTLKQGEFFYILEQRKNMALLFKFKGIERNKIIGINPIDNTQVKIDPSLFVGKVK